MVVGRVAPPFDLGGEEPGDFAVARYNADGSLDTDADADPGTHFSTDGKATTEFAGGGGGEAHDVTVQGDGKIVVVGDWCADGCGSPGVTSDFTLARYNADGSLDTNADADPGTHRRGREADDRLRRRPRDSSRGCYPGRRQARHRRRQLDLGFRVRRLRARPLLGCERQPRRDLRLRWQGAGERLRERVGHASRRCLQPGGEIVIAGQQGGDGSGDFALARYLSTGSPDTGFDGDGQVTTDFGAEDGASAVAISGTKIVAAGSSRTGASSAGPGPSRSPATTPTAASTRTQTRIPASTSAPMVSRRPTSARGQPTRPAAW